MEGGRKADSDLKSARRLLEGDGPYDTACFHAQQATEKYLKAALARAAHEIPKTHDLEELQRIATPIAPELATERVDLSELSGYAVEMRYDIEFWPDRDVAASALTIAGRVRAAVVARFPDVFET